MSTVISPLAATCPLPFNDYPAVTLAHGGGGRFSKMLVEQLFYAAFANPTLATFHDGALMNLASLYTARGDTAGAARYRDRLERLRLRNPYHHFMQAVDAERRDDHATAARQYRRAIALYDAEHRFHSGRARALLHLGDARGAGRALQRAHDLSKGDMQARYQAKLDLLRRKGL